MRRELINDRAKLRRLGAGAQEEPESVRGWLQSANSLQSAGPHVTVRKTIANLETKLPGMIEEAVTLRFHQMAGNLQQEIEETHVRTLESFVKNVQVKLVQRVSALETDVSSQAEAMNELREYSQRTEDSLERLMVGVEGLANHLPKRLQAATTEGAKEAPAKQEKTAAERTAPTPFPRRSQRFLSPKAFAVAVAAALMMVLGAFGLGKILLPKTEAGPASSSAGTAAPMSKGAAQATSLAAGAESRMQVAREYMDRKDYVMAENICRELVKADPNNTEAMKALASVLYRQDKIDESAAILDRLPKDTPPGGDKVSDIPKATP